APAPPNQKNSVAAPPPLDPHFAIQVASFQTMTGAGRLVEQLKTAGYAARANEMESGDEGRIVEGLVGDYSTGRAADPDLSVLKTKHGFLAARVEPFVKNRLP